jgi:hypothetical protein
MEKNNLNTLSTGNSTISYDQSALEALQKKDISVRDCINYITNQPLQFSTQPTTIPIINVAQDGQLFVDNKPLSELINIPMGKVSDGYHTFDELYEHRVVLFMTLCRVLSYGYKNAPVWKSQVHSDGSTWAGWFIMGINDVAGAQITYHLPMSKWEDCWFAPTLEKAPDFDGHTSNDVLERLKTI